MGILGIAFENEGDLVFEIVETIVYGRGAEHQDFCFDAVLNHLQKLLVARFFIFFNVVVSEVMRLIYDDKIVIAPVDTT